MDIILIFILGLAVIVGIAVALESSRMKVAKETREKKAESLEQTNRAADQFEASIDDAWPVRLRDAGEFTKEYLMMSGDQRQIRRCSVRLRPEYELRTDFVIEIADVVSAELQQSSQTIMHFETHSVTKKKSPLLRAAVGGVMLGPVGAVVGASSAGSTTTGTSEGSSTTRKGPIYLVIGTTDIHQPVLKMQMPSMSTAEEWLHRIRGAVAKAN